MLGLLLSLSLTPELVLQGVPQSPMCPPDLTCSYLPHRQYGFCPGLDCKVRLVGDSLVPPKRGPRSLGQPGVLQAPSRHPRVDGGRRGRCRAPGDSKDTKERL